MYLSNLSIRRPVFATMLIVALLVLGVTSYFQLNVDLFPEVDFPVVAITTAYPGAGPEAVEAEVTKKIEDAVNPVAGIKHIASTSQEGFSTIIAEFTLETRIQDAAQEVREKVAAIRAFLPKEIEEPVIARFDPASQPIISLAISGERSLRDLTTYTKNKIKKRLESIPGVGSVELVGGAEREIQVALAKSKLVAHDLPVEKVVSSIASANIEIPGGKVGKGQREALLRTLGRFDPAGGAVPALQKVIVSTRQGRYVRLGEIAAVADSVKEPTSLSSLNGREAVGLDITRQSGANTVAVASAVKAELARLEKELPPEMKIILAVDRSVFIHDAIDDILVNIYYGGALAILVIFLFLANWRSTLISALAIPTSIIATFTLMRLLHFTVNFMSLLGLSLAVGLLIDDAIVVIENIYRHLDRGESAREAAKNATAEIGLAVMATTFSIVVVFLPVAFMSGIVGRFFYQFGMTVAAAVLVSLFVAFTLTPMLSSRLLRPETKAERRGFFWKIPLGWNAAFQKLNGVYRRVLAWALGHRKTTVAIALGTFVASFILVPFMGVEFIPQSDRGEFVVNFETPTGSSLAHTAAVAEKIEQRIRRHPEVTTVLTTIGAGQNEVHQGRINVKLVERSKRKAGVFTFMNTLRWELAGLPGIKLAIGTEGMAGRTAKQIELSVRGDDPVLLRRLAGRVEEIVRRTPGTVDVDNSEKAGKPELRVAINRDKASDLGLSPRSIAATLRTLVDGEVATKYQEGDEQYDVRVRLAEGDRSNPAAIAQLAVASTKEIEGKKDFLVPLNQVATLVEETGPTTINRYDRQREILITANVSGHFFGNVIREIQQQTGEISPPPGFHIGATGQAEAQKESFGYIFQALFLAVVFVYLLLASQFESFVDPFAIMLSLPLSLVGAFLGLFLTGSSVSIMSLIGVVMLMGLVTKNAILLVDFTKQLRRKGVERTEALLTAGPIRLRPILMTTFAMVFGMAPLALGFGPGAEMRAPMARAVIGGVISSTLLTLVVVPVVYTMLDDLVHRKRKTAPLPVTES